MSFLKKLDWKLLLSVTLLLVLGLLSLLSTAPDLFYKQIIWIVISVLVGVFLIVIDLRSFFSRKSIVFSFYWLVIGVLVLTYFLAPQIKGNRAWIILGSFQFQPSELAKIALIIVLSYFLSRRHIGIARWGIFFSSFFYGFFPALLIAIQPDLGSALVVGAVWAGFVLISGLPLKKVFISALVLIVSLVLIWSYVLKDYQKERIAGLFNPQEDPLGINYNVIQSKIAIGSGGLFGKGFGQGTQVQLGFLPEAQTDFIFAAIAEEGGFLAIIVLCLAFMGMILRILKIGLSSEANFYKFLSLGSVILFLTQFILHVGSNLGLLPVIGVTLPFVSYGGSSILSSMILVGMIQSAYSKK
ncbi:MAG: Rod shape-determining protein RodA [Candidatus Wolfebacteria bacterium GW2011_GWC1_43_10]|uniref:Rod shape-determining protein RodA n=1 Tax=Candidatus Wolfebacteria bacterium GW2011_GWC1_43_10 TaxID=1619011 RepID=A0A0G1CAT1_9BACT|nr:MAG: Rod shape-determining protein RodA [Candidatus Wolfebacteria bacterium GW2011_GWC1_43_10]